MTFRSAEPFVCFVAVTLMFAAGCGPMTPGPAADSKTPGPSMASTAAGHPRVRVEGTDGTIISGALMNGTVSIECGQGLLTLQTDYISTITFSDSADTIQSPSIQVSGKIRETQFLIRNEHGVMPLQKERLRTLTFPDGPKPTEVSEPTTRRTPGTDHY